MVTIPDDQAWLADLSLVGDGSGMQHDYLVLSAAERARGFVRPVRRSYTHRTCGGSTTMALTIAETYAANPRYYGATYCSTCHGHYPVGPAGEFVWDDGTAVGS